jgi:hypothetical protein
MGRQTTGPWFTFGGKEVASLGEPQGGLPRHGENEMPRAKLGAYQAGSTPFRMPLAALGRILVLGRVGAWPSGFCPLLFGAARWRRGAHRLADAGGVTISRQNRVQVTYGRLRRTGAGSIVDRGIPLGRCGE